MKPVRLIVAGAGSRGSTYAAFALQHPDKARVVAVAESRSEHRIRLAAQHNLAPSAVFSDWQEMLRARIDAEGALITLPDRLHEPAAIGFAEAGYNMLLEKPMAHSYEACRNIVDSVKQADILFAVCHVLRYTRITKRLQEILRSGAIGTLVSVQHLEPVGFWHQAHSFVRGNWRKESESGFMLLTKSCHDIDWLQAIVGQGCKSVSSFGSLMHFRPAQRPSGAASRCLDCDLRETCPYSATRFYLSLLAKGETGWPLDILTHDMTKDGVLEALGRGPYGRCVYDCDNDVVDHQVVNLLYEGGCTASFSMNAFNKPGKRRTRLFGTHGEISLVGTRLRLFDFATEREYEEDLTDPIDTALSGHHNGDYRMMEAFVRAISENDQSYIKSGPSETLQSHLTVFAAEQARLEHRVVDVVEWLSG